MADCFITGSASIISHSFGNPKQNSPVICENSAQIKTSVESSHPKNGSGTVSIVHNNGKIVVAGETLLGKTQSAMSDAPIPLSNTRSAEIIEDSTKKVHTDTRSGVSSAPVLDVDLGCFIFPEAVNDVSSNKSCGRVSSQGGSALESSVPKAVLGDRPKINESNQTLEVPASGNGISPQFGANTVGLNHLKDPVIAAAGLLVTSKIPVVPTPVANSGSAQNLEGLSSAPGVPSGSPFPGVRVPGSVKPISAADLRGAVSPEVWARFPEAVWIDAAVIASEILTAPPPEGSAASYAPTVAQGMAILAPPNIVSPAALLTGAPVVPPVVKPVTPSDPSANGPDPKAPTFAAMVSKENVFCRKDWVYGFFRCSSHRCFY
ncbi:hypothetical protein OROHE_021238 [Orobanche hederae]